MAMKFHRSGSTRPIFLIGFQLTGNLGLRYLSSSLRERGHRVVVFDVEMSSDRLLETTERE